MSDFIDLPLWIRIIGFMISSVLLFIPCIRFSEWVSEKIYGESHSLYDGTLFQRFFILTVIYGTTIFGLILVFFLPIRALLK